MQLFVERARAVQPDFALTDQNAAFVAQVCRKLDGIPLALELAAARVLGSRPEQIAARLDDRFRLLTGGSLTALPRQQTLRGTLDWSYDLLSELERTLFRRLAVFAGAFTLEAAEAVGAGDGIATDEVIDLLAGLVSKSMVVVGRETEAVRYRLLETVRQYAWEASGGRRERARLPTSPGLVSAFWPRKRSRACTARSRFSGSTGWSASMTTCAWPLPGAIVSLTVRQR